MYMCMCCGLCIVLCWSCKKGSRTTTKITLDLRLLRLTLWLVLFFVSIGTASGYVLAPGGFGARGPRAAAAARAGVQMDLDGSSSWSLW